MKLIRSALVVTAAAIIPLLPTAAQADRYVQNDTVGDVLAVADGGSTTPAPDRVEGDLVRSSIRHKSRAVVLTMRFRDLSRLGQGQLFFYGIKTGHLKRYVTVDTAPGHWGGRMTLNKPDGKKFRCHVTRKVDYTANTATVWVPRSCLGRPRWVKAAMQEASFDVADTVYFDDARTNARLFNYPVWSPRVYR